MSGSKLLNIDLMSESKPLNTDKTMIRAIVHTITPTSEMADMMLMMLCDFFEKRYRRATKAERFIAVIFSADSQYFADSRASRRC